VSKLPEDALLFVFGDHGMTDSGEHGGASLEETDSALFIYSPSPIFEVQCVSDDYNIRYSCVVHHCDI
jgi:phosphatidylinositol glycan class O